MPRKTSLSLTTLNCGRMLQPRTRAYLQSLGSAEPLPDVLCLQDFPFRDLPLVVDTLPHIAVGPMTNHLIDGVRAAVGIVLASRYFLTDIAHHTVWGDGVFKDLQGVVNNHRSPNTAETDLLIDTTEDRVAIFATVRKGGVEFNVATTHGYWVRGGVITERQWKSTRLLKSLLMKQAFSHNGLVLAGDLNFGRGNAVYQEFVQGLRDCVPAEFDNTLDPERGFRVVSDYVVTAPDLDNGEIYTVSDVRLRSGVSDHCALSCVVTKE